MLLKAGTYRFNSNIVTSEPADYDNFDKYQLNYSYNGVDYNHLFFAYDETYAPAPADMLIQQTVLNFVDLPNEILLDVYHLALNDGNVSEDYNGYMVEIPVDVVLYESQDVTALLGEFFISNTNYNEVNGGDTIYTEKSSWYKSVADAIRNKKGTTAPILRDDFASEISSITGGGETPYYDGTVIIEKAESVLGLRRFKSMLNFEGIISLGTIDEISTFIQNEANQISIEVIELANYNVSKLIPYHYVESGGSVFGIASLTADGGLGDDVYNDVNGEIQIDHIRGVTINVISCGSNVEQWLLANTEGVSE